MSKLQDVIIDYDEIDPDGKGGYFFEKYKEQIPDNSDKITVSIGYSGFDATDVTARLVQSVDGENWQDVQDSEVTIDEKLSSHTWNLAGYSTGLYIAVHVNTGAATTGQVDTIKYLV